MEFDSKITTTTEPRLTLQSNHSHLPRLCIVDHEMVLRNFRSKGSCELLPSFWVHCPLSSRTIHMLIISSWSDLKTWALKTMGNFNSCFWNLKSKLNDMLVFYKKNPILFWPDEKHGLHGKFLFLIGWNFQKSLKYKVQMIYSTNKMKDKIITVGIPVVLKSTRKIIERV